MTIGGLEALPPHEPPKTTGALNQFLNIAATKTGQNAERLSWLSASVIVMAVLQRARGADGEALFLIKGGAYLEHRLSVGARATKDVDTLFRGAVTGFMGALDHAIAEPWGPFEIARTEVEVIENAKTTAKPRRFYLQLKIRGQVFRRIKVEVSFGEGSVGKEVETFRAPNLLALGLETPDEIAGITMAYQIAQKLHASSDPDVPNPMGESRPYFNDRVRDLVDLMLLRDAYFPDGSDLGPVKIAAVDVFNARSEEATKLGLADRTWPPTMQAWALWPEGWQRPADQAGVTVSLEEALASVNAWIIAIDEAAST